MNKQLLKSSLLAIAALSATFSGPAVLAGSDIGADAQLNVNVLNVVCAAQGSGNECAIAAATVENSSIQNNVSALVFADEVIAVASGSSNVAEISMAGIQNSVIGGNAGLSVIAGDVVATAQGSANVATIDLANIK